MTTNLKELLEQMIFKMEEQKKNHIWFVVADDFYDDKPKTSSAGFNYEKFDMYSIKKLSENNYTITKINESRQIDIYKIQTTLVENESQYKLLSKIDLVEKPAISHE